MAGIILIPIKPRGPIMDRAAVLKALSGALTDTAAEGLRFIAEYPPAVPESRYKRTGKLKGSWSMKPAERRGDRMTAEVGSNSRTAPYNRKVQGEQQDPFFRRRGWRNTDMLVKLIREQLPRRAQAAINRAIR